MSKTVDERVVEMRFDNGQFERNVKTTLTTLDKLKAKLNLTGASKGLQEVQQTANKMSFVNVESSLGFLEKRFSTMGIVGMTVIQNLTTSFMGFASKLTSFATGGIIEGGLRRATNLQNAKFQLQGLLKDGEKVAKVMEDVNYGVQDTAYSLDAAANVAAQLAASGLEAGDKMKAALRGVSGVAAMTNSSYEEIGNVFTRVAGQGRVMATDLNSLAARGMNAAATLGQALGKSEAEIRDMVSKGKISFDIFAKAMDDAFGEHAKEANRTMNGALSNIRAALAKIGAEFFEPIIKMDGPLVNMLNAIRERINDIKADVIPFLQDLSGRVGNIINNIGNKIRNGNKMKYNPFYEGLEDDGKTKKYAKSMEQIQAVAAQTGMTIQEVEQNIEKLNSRFLIFNSIKNIGEGIATVFKSIGKAFSEVFGGKAQDSIFNFAAGLNKITTIIKDKLVANADKIYNTFKGLFSILSFGINIIKGIATVIGNLLGSLFGVSDGILSVTSAFGKWISGIHEGIKKTNAFNVIISKLGEFIRNFTQGLKDFLHGFVNTFGQVISSVAKAIGGAVKRIFTALGNAISSGDAAKFMDLINKGIFSMVLLKVKNFINYLGKGGTLFDTLKRYADSFKSIADNIAGILNTVKGALQAWQNDLKAKTLFKIAAAVGILALALVTLSDIDKDKLKNALSAITTLFIDLVVALKVLAAGTMTGAAKKMTLAIGLAMSVLILASALKKIATLDTGDLIKGVLAVAVLVKIMSSAMQKLATDQKKAIKGALGIIALAVAIRILASACKVFAAMSWEEMARGLVAVGVLLGELWAFTRFAKTDGKLIKIGLATVILAAGLKILANVCKDFATMSWEDIGKGLAAVGGLLVEIGGFMSLTKFFKKTITVGIALNIFALAIKQMVDPLKSLAEMSWDEIGRGLVALGGALTILTAAIGVLTWIANKGGFWGGINMNFAAMSIEMLTKLLGKIVEAFKGFASISWDGIIKSLVSIGVSIGVLVLATKKLQTKEIGAIIAAAISLNILAKSIALLGSLGLEGVAVGLLGIAGVFTILTVAMKFLIPMSKGMLKVAGSIAALSGSLALLGLAMGVMGLGFGVFTTSLITAFLGFKLIGWDTIAKGLIGIAGAFIIIGVAAHVLSPMIGAIFALAGAIAVFSLSVAAIGVGVSLIVQALATMAAVGKEGAESAGAALKALVSNMLELIPIAIKQLGLALKELLIIVKDMIPLLGEILIDTVHTLVQVLITCAPEIVEGFFELIVQALTMLNKYVPTIANLLFDFMINVLNTLSIRLPEFVTAVINFLARLFDAVVQVFSEFGAGELLKAVVALGVLTIVMHLMASLIHIIPQAMLGILAFGVLVTELAAVIAAVGALSKIPGFKELVTDGGNFLQIIGTAIGQFVGGIVGGIAKGISSALPEIATNLSEFITNLQPFIEGIKAVDLDMLGKVGILSASMLLLNGAGFVSGVMSLLTFLTGNTLASLGTQLSEFMNNSKGFIEGVSGIDPNMLASVKGLADALIVLTTANLINGISKFLGIFTGGNSLADFGIQIALLGAGMRKFVDNLGTFGDDQIKAVNFACEALKILSEAGKQIPNSGGLAAFFAGDNDIGAFGAKLPLLGAGMSAFVKSLGKFDEEQIKTVTCAANAIKILSEAGNQIPNSGGLAAFFAGDNDIGEFGEKLPKMGKALKSFVSSLEGGFSDTDKDVITFAAEAIKALAQSASEIPNSGGIGSWFAGDNDLSEFGDKLPGVGKNISGFVNALGKFGKDQIDTAKFAAQCIAEMAKAANDIPNSGGLGSLFGGDNDISQFGEKLPSVGESLNGFVSKLGTFGKDQLDSAKMAAECIATMCEAAGKVPNSGGLGSLFGGDNDISQFGNKLPGVGQSIAEFVGKVKDLKPDQVGVAKTAAEIITTLASANVPSTGGLGSLFSGENDISQFAGKLPKVGEAISSFVTSLTNFNTDGADKARIAAETITNMAKAAEGIPNSGGIGTWFAGDNDISQFAGKLPGVGENLNGFATKLGTFTDDQKTTISCAMEALKTIASVDIPNSGGLGALFGGEKDITQFAGKFPVVGSMLKEFMTNIGEFDKTKLDTVNLAIEAIKALTSLSSLNVDSAGKNLEEFGARITSFAWKLKEYLDAMNNNNADTITESINKIKQVIEMAQQISTEGIANLENFTNQLSRLGTEGIKAFVDAVTNEQPKNDAINGINNMIQGIIDKIESRKEDVKGKGESLVNILVEVVTKPEVANKAAEGGKFFVQGFANGINNNLYLARDAGSQVGKKALEAAKRAIDSNSPSKETYKLGTFFDQGFVNGIKAFGDNIYKESYSVGDRARLGLSKAIKGVSDLILNGIDDDITIRPILDLSNVEDGVATMNGMFGTPSIGVMSNLNAISTGMRMNRQNGGEDIVSAIDKLGKSLGNTNGDTYNINGITYDDGSEISEAVKTLVRAARIERRT